MKLINYFKHLEDIDFDFLKENNIKLLLIDRDNTCVPVGSEHSTPEVISWVSEAKDRGFSLCMLSNNFHSKEIKKSADELGVPKLDHAMKPFPFSIWHVIKKFGYSKDEVALIGDQFFTDGLAGKSAGVMTILVEPQTKQDIWYTHIFRFLERTFKLRG